MADVFMGHCNMTVGKLTMPSRVLTPASRRAPQLLAGRVLDLVTGVARDAFLQDIGKLRECMLGRPVCLRVRRDGVEFAMRTERKGLELERQLAHHRDGHVVGSCATHS